MPCSGDVSAPVFYVPVSVLRHGRIAYQGDVFIEHFFHVFRLHSPFLFQIFRPRVQGFEEKECVSLEIVACCDVEFLPLEMYDYKKIVFITKRSYLSQLSENSENLIQFSRMAPAHF